MSQQLFLAANLVHETLIFGHLQIVFEDARGNLLETESTSPGFPYFFGDWVFPSFGRTHNSLNNTPGYGDPDAYAIAALELRPQQTAEHVWELIGQIYSSLKSGGYGIDYDIGQNSNSYAASLLSVVGISAAGYLSAITPPDVLGFPGVGTNIFQGAKTGGLFSGYDTPIPLALAGTTGNDYIKAGIGNDVLKGRSGQDTIKGQDGDDSLVGNGGNDRLRGGDGRDVVVGGTGRDVMSGDGGNDTFVFSSVRESKPGSRKDKITDFDGSGDKIDLSAIDARIGPGNQVFDFVGTSDFSGTRGELRYDKKSSSTLVQADQDGDGQSDFEILLTDSLNLQAGDFIL